MIHTYVGLRYGKIHLERSKHHQSIQALGG
jgi:hypothetical protein